MKKLLIVILLALSFVANSQVWQGKFEQLGTQLPTPNQYRNASGAPGAKYWQQQADYKIDVKIDENTLKLTGFEKITYTNNSPNKLNYLWVQLDQNVRQKNALGTRVSTQSMSDSIEAQSVMNYVDDYNGYDGGFKITTVKDTQGNNLPYMIVETMMRIDIPIPLNSGNSYSFHINWWYNMYDRMLIDGRGGYEYFPKDDNYAFTLTQWYPRMAVYDNVTGWQQKQFLGRGEFALTFGNYEVNITVPSNHIVGSTGWLQNEKEVLSEKQQERWKKAQNSTQKIVFIVTEKEAKKNEKSRAKGTKTWSFKATNVRDFAFTSSKKYIWDAISVPLKNHKPLAMSFYPKEGNPLWAKYSTKAISNTLHYYSEKTIDYPYPVAISVHAADQGMEYPMICFNYGRPYKGRYSRQQLEEMVSVIVHEVGHNFFSMIINSDERQWTWMDEGLNSFMEHNTLVKYYPSFNLTWGTPKGITNYMKGNPDYICPIMTNSEQIKQFGYNAYGKPSAALVLLRETIMGKKLFDIAYKEYAQRWAFKHPTPADFFRTMEDASAIDLDWFWRGWFYSIDHVDIELSNVRWFKTNTPFQGVGNKNNIDFSDGPSSLKIIDTPDYYYGEFKARVEDKAISNAYHNKNFYELSFKNVGGLVSPIIIEWTYVDGTKEIEQIPAEIWRLNEKEVKKVFLKSKEVINITIDPNEATGDTERGNNYFPKRKEKSKFKKFKNGY